MSNDLLYIFLLKIAATIKYSFNWTI